MCRISPGLFENENLGDVPSCCRLPNMEGRWLTVVALLFLCIAALIAAVNPPLAFGVIAVVFLAALGLLIFRWKQF